MDRIGAGDLRGGEDRRDVEIALARRRRADADAFIGEPHMHGVVVGGRMYGDRADAHLPAGAVNAERDLAAIGDEHFLKHRSRALYSRTARIWPNSTGVASATRICVTRPARGAGIWFITFIASMMNIVWPSRTVSPTAMIGVAPGRAPR